MDVDVNIAGSAITASCYDLYQGRTLRMVCGALAIFLQNYGTVIISAAVILVTFVSFRVRESYKYAAVPFAVSIPEQCQPGWVGKVLEKPSIKVSGTQDIQCYCPANGKFLSFVRTASCADIDIAIAKATKAQNSWSQTSFDARRKVLRTLLGYILSHQDAIVQASCLDSGKTRIDAALGEILVTTEKIKYLLDYGEQALRPEKRPTSFLMAYKRAELRYEPLGVVAALVSWNYPFHNLLGPIISSIFVGNGIVVKGSENTAWSSGYYIQIMKGALSACGHDPELVQTIICWPDTAPYLTSHPGIQHVTFIGSRPVAHQVAASAAKTLVPLCVELGGKDAHIILDDVKNLDALCSVLMRGVFQSASQNCIGIERIIALPKVYHQLIDILNPKISNLRLGSALDEENVDMGAMISPACFDKLEKMIEEAVSKGARCLVGGKRYLNPRFPKGHYFSPTLLVDVTPDMEIAQNETFAPICVIMPAKSVGEAISIANSADFGLGGSVYGRNKAHIDRVISEMKCGMIAVNDFASFYLNQSLPFGGVRSSGYGRFAGQEGLRGVCALKSVLVDRWPSLINTVIPPVVDYPITRPQRSWNFTKGLVEFAYGQGLRERAAGISRLLGNM